MHLYRIFVLVFCSLSISSASANNVEEMLRMGQSYLSLGAPERATQVLSSVIDEAPNSAAAYLLRAEAHLMLDKQNEAYRDYQRAIEIDPKFVKTMHLKRKRGIQSDSIYLHTVFFDPFDK